MWNPKDVAAHPGDPTQWKRLTVVDDRTDFPKFKLNQRRLQYRLSPIPYPNPPPATPLGPTDSHWLVLRDHFDMARQVFQTAHDFFVKEYSDGHHFLGKPPGNLPASKKVPTPIDDPQGHFIIHPDYGRINHGLTSAGTKKQNIREAHFNHIHAQLGPS